MNILAMIADDPNLDPQMRAVLERSAAKAGARRFTGEAPTGFSALTDDEIEERDYLADRARMTLEERAAEVRDHFAEMAMKDRDD
jgi:hypothetical protein